MKCCGAILILTAGTMAALGRLRQQRSLQKQCRCFLQQLRQMEESIRCFHTPLPTLFEYFAGEEREAAYFFSALLNSLRFFPDMPLPTHWEGAAQVLPKELQTLLGPLGQELCGDEEGVLAALENTIRNLDRRQVVWDSERKERERLWCGLCFSATFFLILLLL